MAADNTIHIPPDQPRNSLPRRRRVLSPLPHSWHSCHSFIDDTGLCAARAGTGACDSRKGRSSFGLSVRRTACTSYRCPELSSKENNLTNATNEAVDNTRFYSQSGPDQPKKTVCLAVEECSRHCPIRGIPVIRSLTTRNCAPRGREQGCVSPEKHSSFGR